MRTIVHISDLHFDRTIESLLDPLRKIIAERAPHLIIISGDLTQRAKISEFRQAQSFLSSLNFPFIVIPGNHDIPLYSFWERFPEPFERYKKYIGDDLEPAYADSEIAVKGVNTVRPLRLKEGSINKKQLSDVKKFFSASGPDTVKIVVSHHPFNVPVTYPRKPLKRAEKALKDLENSKIDILLAGHHHDNMLNHQNSPFQIEHKGPLVIQAGTVFSTRRRVAPNSFNIIEIDRKKITWERLASTDACTYVLEQKNSFVHNGEEWEKA